MNREVSIGNRKIGDGHPAYIIGEIGINHNGDINVAKKLMEVARNVGADAVKFQKRTPELCVPEHQRNQMRDTPWGYITTLIIATKWNSMRNLTQKSIVLPGKSVSIGLHPPGISPRWRSSIGSIRPPTKFLPRS